MDKNDIIWKTSCSDRLYKHSRVSESISSGISTHRAQHKHSYKERHERLGYTSSLSYQQISVLCDDVSSFSKSITNNLICTPCITGKMKKALIRQVENRFEPLAKIDYDISRRFSKSLGGHHWGAQFIEVWLSKTVVFFFKQTFELTSIILSYTATKESAFSSHDYHIRRIWCENARETYLPNY